MRTPRPECYATQWGYGTAPGESRQAEDVRADVHRSGLVVTPVGVAVCPKHGLAASETVMSSGSVVRVCSLCLCCPSSSLLAALLAGVK